MDPISMLGAFTSFGNFVGGQNDSEKQQQYTLELMRQQSKYNKEATDYQYQKQLDMFNATGYQARVNQLKAAGLSPGLIYGMGAGGGGGVTGNITAPQVSQGTAPNVSASRAVNAGMALQLAKLKSEIDVNESIAESNRATVPLKGSQTTGQDLENSQKQLDLEINQLTKESKIDNIVSAAQKMVTDSKIAIQDLESKTMDNVVKQQTIDDRIKQVNATLQNTIADTLLKKSEINVNKEEIQSLAQNIIESQMRTKRAAWDIEDSKIHNELESKRIYNEYVKVMGEDFAKNNPDLLEKLIQIAGLATVASGLKTSTLK